MKTRSRGRAVASGSASVASRSTPRICHARGSEKMRPPSTSWWTARYVAAPKAVRLGSPSRTRGTPSYGVGEGTHQRVHGRTREGADVGLEHAGDVERVPGELQHLRARVVRRGADDDPGGDQAVDHLGRRGVAAEVHAGEGL